VGADVSVDSKTFLMTDFMNLKIKSAQFFRYAHRGRMCMRVSIEMSDHTCISIYVGSVFLIYMSFATVCTINMSHSFVWI
jgi:hypothetical protein